MANSTMMIGRGRVSDGDLRRLASEVAKVTTLVDLAKIVCAKTAELGAVACLVAFHAPDGKPLLVIDNVTSAVDDTRLAWIAADWQLDAPYMTMLARRTPIVEFRGGIYVSMTPLVEPSGVVCGSIRTHHDAVLSRELERELWMASTMVSVRMAELGLSMAPRLGVRLTPRQRDVALLATRGLTNEEIGRELGISLNTVKNRLKDVFVRLDVRSRVELGTALRQTPAIVDVSPGVTRDGDIAISYSGPDRALVESRRA